MKKFLCAILILTALVSSACSASSSAPASTTSHSTASIPAASLTSKSAPSVSTPSSTGATSPAVSTTFSPATTTSAVKQWSSPPVMQIDTSRTYYALVETSLGSFKIKLFANESPRTVNNFVFLSQQHFYEGIIFHRIIQDFMIQTGDPTGTGRGGPGYKFDDELPVKHSYDVGIVAMANAGTNTQGSQFFICTGSSAKGLDTHPNYTQFGQVVEGMNVVQKIAAVKVGSSTSGEASRPLDPPFIKTITISVQ